MTLINRCLLTVSPNKKLMMHQLFQDMGRNIVREESQDPAKHTRVWCSDEAYHVLTKGDGSETIEGLAVDTRKIKKGTKAISIKTRSLEKMDKLKLLQLKYVELTGTYKNFPELRWLSWHGCHLKAIPSAIPMCSLVSLDMTHGNLKMFEPPVVLNSLKFLNLQCCTRLVRICNLSRLPKLETLDLSDCLRLTHICETIGGLNSLALFKLTRCRKLWKVLLKHELVSTKPLFSLPRSLKFLFLNSCDLEYNNDVRVVFHGQSLHGLSLQGNLFEFLPNTIDVKMLRVLNLTSCKNLKSILYLPNTLEELYTDWCKSLEKITFESARFRLKKFGYKDCFRLSEVQGLFKLVSIAKLDVTDLGHMKWIKAYQVYKVDLMGDEITKGRIWHIQMLFEYGIMSTYLQGIKDQSMMLHEYTSSSSFLCFHLPLDLKARMIQGLNVTTLYRFSRSKNKDTWLLFAKVSNRTKGVTWIYNPVVYCKPKVDEDVAWLSYWPIGNILDAGDEVEVEIIVEKEVVVSWCGASIVYTSHGEVEQEGKRKSNKKMEEVIGGDLSEFEITPGVYYLCRRDFFKSNLETFDWMMRFFSELQGWRKFHQSQHLDPSCMHLTFSLKLYRDTLNKRISLRCFNCNETEICKIKKVVSRLEGVDSVCYHKNTNKLCARGNVDCMAVETCVREFEKTVRIEYVHYMTKPLLKRYHMKIALLKSLNRFWYWHIFATRKKFF